LASDKADEGSKTVMRYQGVAKRRLARKQGPSLSTLSLL
jgi:hypothetical protein